MRPEPKPYERYRHFKGRDYQVLLIATDAGSGRKCVVYQGLYEPFRIYVRDMEEFLSEVDRGKYPYAQQKERFALLDVQESEGAEKNEHKDIHIDTEKDRKDSGHLAGESDPKQEKAAPKKEILSEKAEKITLSHAGEGKSIFAKKERTEENSIFMVDAAVGRRQIEPETVKEENNSKSELKEHRESERRTDDAEKSDVVEKESTGAASAVDPSLTLFLDAETVEKKLEVLFKERNRLTPKTLMLIELSLGLEVQNGDVEDRYQRIRSNLQMRQKYERHRPG